ncbi:MAG: hypothetical protein IJ574_01060 [Bacilli bacterium]|nr:hypothetical protein [Bacilli bacterium]
MKSKKKMNSAIIVLLAVIIGLVITYALKMKSNEVLVDENFYSNKNSIDTDNMKEINLDSKIIDNVLNPYLLDVNCDNEPYYNILISKIYTSSKLNDFLLKDKLYLAISNLFIGKNSKNSNYDMNSTINLTDINKFIKSAFNDKEISINDVKKALDIDVNNLYKLNNYYISINNTELNVSLNNCKYSKEYVLNKLLNAKENKDYLYIEIKSSYIHLDLLNKQIYTTNIDNEEQKEYFNKDKLNDNELNWDLYNTYKWSFKKVNKNYYLESVEKI